MLYRIWQRDPNNSKLTIGNFKKLNEPVASHPNPSVDHISGLSPNSNKDVANNRLFHF